MDKQLLTDLQWILNLPENDSKQVILPKAVYELVYKEMSEDEDYNRVWDVPVSGIGKDGRMWLACTELIVDEE